MVPCKSSFQPAYIQCLSLRLLLLLLLCDFCCTQFFLLLAILCHPCLIICLEFFGNFHSLACFAAESTFSLQHRSCYQTLDLRRFLFLASFTASFFSRANSFRMFAARFGPKRRGLLSSVSPGMSSAPFLATTNCKVARSGPTMQPRTDLRLRQPVRRSR